MAKDSVVGRLALGSAFAAAVACILLIDLGLSAASVITTIAIAVPAGALFPFGYFWLAPRIASLKGSPACDGAPGNSDTPSTSDCQDPSVD